MHKLAHGRRDAVDFLIHRDRQGRIAGGKAGLPHRLRLHAADPAVEHQGQRPALGLGFGGEIADELPVGRKPLAARALQAALRREVSVGNNEVALHDVVAYGLDEKALARAVSAHDEAEGRAAIGNDVHIVQQGLDLAFAAHGDIGQADTRHDAALQGVEHRLGNALGHSSVFVHVCVPPSMRVRSSR